MRGREGRGVQCDVLNSCTGHLGKREAVRGCGFGQDCRQDRWLHWQRPASSLHKRGHAPCEGLAETHRQGSSAAGDYLPRSPDPKWVSRWPVGSIHVLIRIQERVRRRMIQGLKIPHTCVTSIWLLVTLLSAPQRCGEYLEFIHACTNGSHGPTIPYLRCI